MQECEMAGEIFRLRFSLKLQEKVFILTDLPAGNLHYRSKYYDSKMRESGEVQARYFRLFRNTRVGLIKIRCCMRTSVVQKLSTVVGRSN